MSRQSMQSGFYQITELQRRREKLEQDHEVAKFQFISTELDMAITFCEMAITSDNQDKTERNVGHARRAYEAAQRFLPDAHLEPHMNQEISDKLTRLEPLIKHLRQYK